jgi:hypothetical protein
VTTDLSNPLANRLLASLPVADFARIRSSLKLVSLKQHLVLNEPGDEVEYVYFPHAGMISLLAVMMDGKAVASFEFIRRLMAFDALVVRGLWISLIFSFCCRARFRTDHGGRIEVSDRVTDTAHQCVVVMHLSCPPRPCGRCSRR